MKAAYSLAFLLITSSFVYAQQPVKTDTIVPGKSNTDKQLQRIKARKITWHSDSTGNEPVKSSLIDSNLHNKYGDLLNDDPVFNKRYPFWRPVIGVLGSGVFAWSVDRFVFNDDYARIGIPTWKTNLTKGWAWDNDRFSVNFIGQPYTGALFFNDGRSSGYNYFQSFPYAVAGSLLWEYFGENTRPSYTDIIITPVTGTFLGEILYRLSSNILDDRTRGANRVFREIAAALVNPKRGFNRLIQGKTYRITNKEVYAKEPVNISFYAGARRLVDENENILGNGTYSAVLNVQLDYGNPFEVRSRKPFDFFSIRADVNFGVGRKILDNINGYGILFGQNKQLGKLALLIGGFQHYDFWDNNTFELGTIGLGYGVVSKLPLSKTSNLYTKMHVALVPFAGSSTRFGPDTSMFRDYNYGGGLKAKFETTLNLGKYATASVMYYFYMISTYIGAPGNNLIHIIKPRITVCLFKSLSIGVENYVYYNDRYLRDYSAIHMVRTEQKVFLLLYLGNKQRRGHSN
jgi:hypothetical protein